ncbi:TetR/AcrR family transcriptional regulator [Actinomadura keratinilytica]|jgi:AcrR family transcriptional regulator|uniref:HTH tetR-type domain-containing protein n=1 Tax=Actinomadura keratinilytica TaxID=547461 RepID=A0ABP7ZFE8_9ACTN
MGRVAGVTAAETRERLLRAAAEAFAARGYDGTRVADIAAAAGVSNGALYAHFKSKAELLVAALRAHARQVLADLLDAEPDRSPAEVLLAAGRRVPHPRDARGDLIVEALAAARRDGGVAAPVRAYVGERVDRVADLLREPRGGARLDPALSPRAVSYLCFLLAVGSALVPRDLPAVDEEEWAALLARLASSVVVPAERTQGAAPPRSPLSEGTSKTGDTQ